MGGPDRAVFRAGLAKRCDLARYPSAYDVLQRGAAALVDTVKTILRLSGVHGV